MCGKCLTVEKSISVSYTQYFNYNCFLVVVINTKLGYSYSHFCRSCADKIQCVLEKLEDSLKLGIPNTFEKLLCVMKNYGKRKKKSDLVQLVRKIRTEADELCTPTPRHTLSQQQLNSEANQEDKLEKVHCRLATLLPTLYKDDIIPDNLIKQLIVLSGPQEQAEYLLREWSQTCQQTMLNNSCVH